MEQQTVQTGETIEVPGNYAIQARGLSKQFGDDFAVRDLNFDVPSGSIFGLIGPSGSGKTTTIRLLTGVYAPTSGEVHVLGMNPKRFNAAARERIGYMPQLFVLYPDLSVWENMNFTASLYGISLFRRKAVLNSLLDLVDLGPHKNKLARQISGGMQRRLTLAATMLHDPQLIFFDEPTAGIDPILRSRIWDRFKELREAGRTLLVTTQYVGEAAYCDYIGVLARGHMLFVDTPTGLRHRAFGGEVIDVHTEQLMHYQDLFDLRKLAFVKKEIESLPENGLRITVEDAGTATPELLEWFQSRNIPVTSVSEFLPPFDDVFVMLVEAAGEAEGEEA